MVIRPALESDAGAIAAIYADEVLRGIATFELDPPDAGEIARRMTAGAGRFPWLVAEDAGAMLGYAYASPYRARAAYRFAAETTVYVAAEAQRRGVGRGLYDVLLATLTAQGFAQALGVISLPNAGSVALHEATGFRRVALLQRVGVKFGRWLDVGYWQRGLAEPGEGAEPRAFADLGLVGCGISPVWDGER